MKNQSGINFFQQLFGKSFWSCIDQKYNPVTMASLQQFFCTSVVSYTHQRTYLNVYGTLLTAHLHTSWVLYSSQPSSSAYGSLSAAFSHNVLVLYQSRTNSNANSLFNSFFTCLLGFILIRNKYQYRRPHLNRSFHTALGTYTQQ